MSSTDAHDRLARINSSLDFITSALDALGRDPVNEPTHPAGLVDLLHIVRTYGGLKVGS